MARAPIVIGRGDDCDIVIDDRRASRRHAEVRFEAGAWVVADLGSHNGTFVDGARLEQPIRVTTDAVLATGNTVFLLLRDTRPVESGVEVRDRIVHGPRLAALWDRVVSFARRSPVLHVLGETGSGKDLVARHFHSCRTPHGPFVAINCATIPPLLAERLLFGARKGTYSGADADSDGYLITADGGVLFLDEIGDLPLEVQAKLLRVIETREVLPLGATKPRVLELSICSATHVDLRTAVTQGRFREDLYFRIANPVVEVPPLRKRREEIPWLVATALEGTGVRAHASFVEAALTRPWPGNVRELATAVTTAATQVKPPENLLKMADLGERVGVWLPSTPESARSLQPSDPEMVAICEALGKENGNVTRAAKSLGLHRNQLRRWLKRNNIDFRHFKPGLLPNDSGDN
jgi:transcriptional regulator with PAS, ATPase and Fis domain